MPLLSRLEQQLNQLAQTKNLRQLDIIDGGYHYDFSDNDYLGINHDSAINTRFFQQYWGKLGHFSASASRLLGGSQSAAEQLETQLSELYHRPALFINSGYHANIGILPAITEKKDLILADKLVHASLIDGMKLSQAELKRYPHLDYEQLVNLLERHQSDYRQIFIVSESLFSMDGDLADLQKLVAIKQQYGAILYIDEAHAVGVYGEKGLGLAEAQGVINDIDILVIPCGKAVASVGAVIICDEIIKQYLINTCRSLIYSTALPPINLAWTAFIFKEISEQNQKRQQLNTLYKRFAENLGQIFDSHICPLIIGSNEQAMTLAKSLKTDSILALPIRHPTVAKNTARLRFSLSCRYDLADIDKVCECIQKHLDQLPQG